MEVASGIVVLTRAKQCCNEREGGREGGGMVSGEGGVRLVGREGGGMVSGEGGGMVSGEGGWWYG